MKSKVPDILAQVDAIRQLTIMYYKDGIITEQQKNQTLDTLSEIEDHEIEKEIL